MVENKIIQIIFDNLKKYIKNENIKFYCSNGNLKYIFNIDSYTFEIIYVFMDDFYRIKLEKVINNEITNIIFLTKSKKFQHDIKVVLKALKISRKSFDNHISAFTTYISQLLNQHNDLSCLESMYISDLRFDGIFI